MTHPSSPAAPPLRLGRAALALVALWLLATVAVAVVFASRPTTGISRLASGRAAFQAVNAATLTGLPTSWVEVAQMPPATQALTVALGGLGLIATWGVNVLALARLARADSCAGRTVAIAALAVPGVLVLVAYALGLAAQLGSPEGVRTLPPVWIDAIAGLGTSGLTWHNAPPGSATFWLGLVPLAVVGAVGPALSLAWVLPGRAPLRRHVRTMLTAMAVAFFVSFLAVAASVAVGDKGGGAVWISAAALATDARSSGFSDALADAPRQARLLSIPLMLLGTGGGVSGGLRVTTAAILMIGVVRLVRGGGVGRTFGIAAIWLAALISLFFVTFLALVATTPELLPDRAAILAAAACGNVGLSVDPVTAAGNDAYILVAAMMVARLAGWGVLWWSVSKGDADLALG